MAGIPRIYHRNYSSTDTTYQDYGVSPGDPVASITDLGWVAPEGMQFKNWNDNRDGTGNSYNPGDYGTFQFPIESVYAIWETAVVPVDYLTTNTELTSIADAIRAKGATSALLIYPTGFVSAINAISTGVDVSDTTAVENDVLAGKYFYKANGSKVQGTIATKTSSNMTVSGATVTAPAGYYASDASKSVASGTAGTPSASKGTVSNHSISVTPSVTNTTGYITGGTKTGTAVSVSASELVSGTLTISSSGTENVTNYASVSVAEGSASTPATTITSKPSISVNSTTGLITATNSKTQSVTPTVSEGFVTEGTAGTITVDGSNTSQLSTVSGSTITPTEAEQTAVTSGKYTLGAIKVGAISSTYIGSDIDRNDSDDMTVTGATVTAPAGYYASDSSKAVASGTAGTPTATKGTVSNHAISVTPSVTNTTGYITGGTKTGTAVSVSASELVSGTLTISSSGTINVTNYASASVAEGSATTPATTITTQPTISVNSTTGLITATNSKTQSVTPTVSEGYVEEGTAGTITVNGSNTSQLSTVSGSTISPTEDEQTAVAAGKYTLGAIKVGAISSTYVGSDISKNDSDDLTVSGATITAPAGYYASDASKSVANGTAGIPTATKGTVSNHAISVTPSVTNTTGYISGGTKTGTAVTVSASELVSGTLAISSSGTKDVTNYASASVAAGSATTPETDIVIDPEITVDSSTGIISFEVDETHSITPTVSAGYVSAGTAGDVNLGGTFTLELTTQDEATITPTEEEELAVAAGKYTLGNIVVAPISSTYVGSGIARKSSTDLSASGATVTVPAGYYASQATKSVSSGTEGTPTATKGTVSGNSISVTPSVTNTAGYISGGTKTGTAVTVSASELVSGTLTISSSGTKDVTNYASVSVASGSATTPATTITTTPSITVSSSGLITATNSKTQNVTPSVSAGYVSSGTAGTITVSGSNTSQLTTQAAQTITPGTTNQTIASGKYLTGTQTILGSADLIAGNIKKNVQIFGVTGTYEGESLPDATGEYFGTGGVTEISFTVNSSPYSAEDGMTWSEFVVSSYNDGKIGINSTGVTYTSPPLNYYVIYNGGHDAIPGSDVIISNYSYAVGDVK